MALSSDMLKEHFDQVEKCQIKWIIKKITRSPWESCYSNLKIYIEWNNNLYFMNGVLPEKDCIIDSFNIVFLEDDIKVWKEVNYFLDGNYLPLNYYSWTVDTSHIPYCTWNIVKEEILENTHSGATTQYQTWEVQETTPVISKKPDTSTQMYGIIAVIVILMIAFAYYLKNYTK